MRTLKLRNGSLLQRVVQNYFLLFFFFPLTAQLPNQDVFGVVQIHLGAAQTQKLGPDPLHSCQEC